ncbi:MAG: hypothetical protein ACYC56_00520 [Candidatus Aquicultor sp.]
MAEITEVSKIKGSAKTGSEKAGIKAIEEQLIYGRILNICMKIGLIGIALTFLVYVTGFMPPKLAIDDVINNWSDAPKASASANGDASKTVKASVSGGATEKAGSEAKKTAYDKLLEENGIHHGWTWVNLYKFGDFINLFPIAFLATITIFCYIAIVPTLLKKGDTIYAVLAILEVLILIGAASGLISGGGH